MDKGKPPENRQGSFSKPPPIQYLTTPLVSCQLPKLDVVGSNPIARCKPQPHVRLHQTDRFSFPCTNEENRYVLRNVSPYSSVSIPANRQKTARMWMHQVICEHGSVGDRFDCTIPNTAPTA